MFSYFQLKHLHAEVRQGQYKHINRKRYQSGNRTARVKHAGVVCCRHEREERTWYEQPPLPFPLVYFGKCRLSLWAVI